MRTVSTLIVSALMAPVLLCAQGGQSGSTAPTAAEVRAAALPMNDNTWWKHAFLYEIYPRSFQDSNGDGVGDLRGITQRMDYLAKLGVDAIWIAPMYPSPQVDFGYDISDYEAIDPQYGTLADFKALQASAEKHHVRVLVDMVMNHTSDKHTWFQESATSRTNPRADWYVWNDGLRADAPGVSEYQKRFEHDGMVPPNNWISGFGGSAWEWVPARKQFYYHRFYVQQPDLNWSNPAVEKAMFDAMRFWLDRGVAGFRLDAIPTLFEDPQLRDNPVAAPGVNAQGDPMLGDMYTDNLARDHEVIVRMRQMIATYPGNRVLVGETYLPDTAELDKWYGGAAGNELDLPMDLLVGFQGNAKQYSAAHFRKYILEAETQLRGRQPLFVFDNHDNVRSIDRYGDGTNDVAMAKTVAALLLTTRGAALTYYGAELGMPTTTPTRREDVKDPAGITGWPREKGRDGERTPMQWTTGPQAGFSTNPKTWLPVPPSHTTINVASETADPSSVLNWHRKLISLRRSVPALHSGGTIMLDATNPDVLSFVRTAPSGAKPVLVTINLSARAQTLPNVLQGSGLAATRGRTLAGTEALAAPVTALQSIALAPFAVWVAELQ